jgi:SAM-dependent methyltransferase
MSTVADYAAHEASDKDQTDQPHGLKGRFTGWMMGLLNRKLNHLTVKELDLDVDDTVLEVGCGAGLAIREIFDTSLCHRVAGIDPSLEMTDHSARRNESELQAGQLDVRLGKVENLPWPDHNFTKVFAISNFHIWDSRPAGLQEIWRVLRPGGTLMLCLRRASEKPRWFEQPGVSEQELAADLELLRQSNFRAVEKTEITCRQPILIITAKKPYDCDRRYKTQNQNL